MLWRAVAVMAVLLLLVRPPGQTNRSPAPPCDRRLSALARRIVHTAWLPVVTQFRPEVQLPASCPLHPWRDQGGPAELAKLHYRVNLWSCSFCGKSFSGESELEAHLETRHPELHAGHDFSVCLVSFTVVVLTSTALTYRDNSAEAKREPTSQMTKLWQCLTCYILIFFINLRIA